MGFRNAEGKEKAIDVALAVDLILGCSLKHFDRAIVIGGDGDHTYAFKIARDLGMNLCVYLMPNQIANDLKHLRITSRYLEVRDLLTWEVCERGVQAGVPLRHKAPPGHPDITPRYRGAGAERV